MTKGVAWEAHELQIAARAYKMATENTISGANQTALNVGLSILCYVKQLQLRGLLDTNLWYGNCVNGETDILLYLKKKYFLNIQKFRKRLLAIENKNPTGVNNIDIHCMTIATHLHFCLGLNYDYTKTFSQCFDPGMVRNSKPT